MEPGSLTPLRADRRASRWLSPLVLICGLVATLLATYLINENLRVKNEERFRDQGSQIERTLHARMEAYIGLLRGGAGLFAASDRVSLEDFQDFHRRLNIPRHYPGLQGFGYTVRTPRALTNEMVASFTELGVQNLRLWPDDTREEYHTIVYLEPLDARNRLAIGYDMFTEQTRRTAMERARDTGNAALSGKVRLVQEGAAADHPGFLLYVPVFRDGMIPATLEERQGSLQGYVYAPFRAGNLFDSVLKNQLPEGLRMTVWDGTNSVPENLLYSTGTIERVAKSQFRLLEVAGRTWTIGYEADRRFLFYPITQVLLVPFFGLIASFLLGYMTHQEARAREETRALNEQLERRVQRRTAALEESTQNMEDFTYTVAHDLRAPLRAMQGFAQALREDYERLLDDPARDYLARIEISAERMDTLIQDLLAYSQLSRSQLSFEPVRIDLAVQAALADHQREIESRAAEISVETTPVSVRAHSATLKHALSNLIDNALKFARPGETPAIRIRTQERDGRVRLAVEDNGIGIAPEHQERIFRVFERLHADGNYPGTGVGLAIVRKGIERMGGKVGVKSHLEQGSLFWIELPKAGD